MQAAVSNPKPAQSKVRQVLSSVKRMITPLERVKDNQLIDRIFLANMQSDSNCVDIGAARGRFLRTFATRAPRGTHHAFEPIPVLAERLDGLFPEVAVHNMALSNEVGETEFHYVPDSSGLSSIKYRGKRFDGLEIEKIKVPMASLDSVLGDTHHVDVIKIDVEGAQYQVLDGARQILTRCKPVVVFEHGRMAEQDYGTTSDMLFDLFTECGMVLHTMEDFLRKKAPLSKTAFDEAVGTPPRDNFVGSRA